MEFSPYCCALNNTYQLNAAQEVLIFLQRNGFTGDDGMEKLADKVAELNKRQYDLANTVKTKERRISKLNEHLEL